MFLNHTHSHLVKAETTAGGIPGWVTTLDCPLRTNSTIFDAAWRDYWIELAELVEPNQVGRPNGTVIAVQVENESVYRPLPDQTSGSRGSMEIIFCSV